MRCPNCGAELRPGRPVDHGDHWHRTWLCLCGVEAVDNLMIPKDGF
ncbi:hypothetical protein SEA_RIE18_78 [Microbacterium phage Rie18]|nr:hypothetical protein SEA_RIE18_78 [Microbacterium phage Rie18]